MLKIISPNAHVRPNVALALTVAWLGLAVLTWLTLGSKLPILPGPMEVLRAMGEQYRQGTFITFDPSTHAIGGELLTSFLLSLTSIFFAALIGLGLSYLAVIPAFRAPVELFGKLRFLSLTGVILYFVLLTPDGHWLKVAVLTFSIVTFFINDMLRVIDDIPKAKFDHARTLGLSPWEVTREVVIRGTLAEALDSLRMNAAMAWMMLTMVEGLSRSEGGVGVVLLNLNRHMDLPALLAIQFVIYFVGIGQDYAIKTSRSLICPYTKVQ